MGIIGAHNVSKLLPVVRHAKAKSNLNSLHTLTLSTASGLVLVVTHLGLPVVVLVAPPWLLPEFSEEARVNVARDPRLEPLVKWQLNN